jgi:hypothetical protein
VIDVRRRAGEAAGQFLLLGSAAGVLLQQASESLAGRVAQLELGPFEARELLPPHAPAAALDPLWFRGGFPLSWLAADDAASLRWREAFITTYLERDIPALGPRIPATTLRRFWTMLAHHQGGLLNQWQLLAEGEPAGAPDTAWRLLERLPEAWLRAVQKFNSGVGEHLQDHPAEAPAAWLPFYFRTLGFAAMADSFGEHSLCEWDGLDAVPGRLVLRNVEPAPFIAPRMKAAGAIVLFSATLHPPAFCCDLLGLPQDTVAMDIPCPFRPEQLAVRIVPISTRRDDRAASLDALVGVLGEQFARQRGNYLAYFSSFDYLELALAAFCQRFPEVPVWSQQRQMAEAQRQAFLRQRPLHRRQLLERREGIALGDPLPLFAEPERRRHERRVLRDHRDAAARLLAAARGREERPRHESHEEGD